MAETYNGWTNYETWCASMWLDNDEGTYSESRSMAEDYEDDPHGFAAALREMMDDTNPLADSASMWTDLLNAAFSEIDWHEIATTILSET